MMKVSGDFYVKCKNCGYVTLVEADNLDYDTSVYERSMGCLLYTSPSPRDA